MVSKTLSLLVCIVLDPRPFLKSFSCMLEMQHKKKEFPSQKGGLLSA